MYVYTFESNQLGKPSFSKGKFICFCTWRTKIQCESASNPNDNSDDSNG